GGHVQGRPRGARCASAPLTWPCPPGLGTRGKEEEKAQMPQQPAASRPGAVPHVLLPAATAGTGGQGGAQGPAGAPLQHTALRKTLWKKTVEVVENLRSARCAQERPPLCRSISRPEQCWK